MIPNRIRALPLLAAALTLSCAGSKIRETTTEKVEATPERLARGKYLVNTIMACGTCHTGRADGLMTNPEDPERELAGGTWLEDGEIGLWIPNITPDAETGLGNWTDDEIMRAIRDGVSRDGRLLFPIMPFGSYKHVSDEDTRAIVAYLRSVPAAKPVTPKRENALPFMAGFMLNRGVMHHEPAKDVKAPDRADKVAYGRYVAALGHCVDCHSMGSTGPRAEDDRFMAGSDGPFQMKGLGKVWAPNITNDPETGIGKKSDAEVKLAIRSGQRFDGKAMVPPMSSLVTHFSLTEEEDLDALVAWLRSLPPVKHQVPARELEVAFAKTLGE